MTAAWQTISGITWKTNTPGTRWFTEGGWTLRLAAIDGVDGWYLTGPGVDQQWMSIQFVASARNAARVIGEGDR
ncbi:hypothetical protein [Streptomyces malaysiensis]|uniref:Uncharacterized protein n=1 Tax=Streptomyces malaysiensis subsp. samsunensis TaxID=459658 RepID=A0A9X2RUT5_STRMQ|nr:hypothetical protein [Streptomyces samsunensis]MCQ8831791.1 hypothetical protein [Streptomyces samsunensis]